MLPQRRSSTLHPLTTLCVMRAKLCIFSMGDCFCNACIDLTELLTIFDTLGTVDFFFIKQNCRA